MLQHLHNKHLCTVDGQDPALKDFSIEALYIKDESERFGLNAFKILCARYAVARVIARTAGLDEQRISLDTGTIDQGQ